MLWEIRGQSVQRVQVENPEGGLQELSDQTGTENAIWEHIHHQRFYLAEEAPSVNPPCKANSGIMHGRLQGGQCSTGHTTSPRKRIPRLERFWRTLRRYTRWSQQTLFPASIQGSNGHILDSCKGGDDIIRIRLALRPPNCFCALPTLISSSCNPMLNCVA